MKLIKLKIFFVVGLFLISNIVFAQSAIYLQNQPNIVVASNKPIFTIRLQSNPTTGYSWFLREYHSNFLVPVRHRFEPAGNKALMGAPGFELWTFRVKNEAFIVPEQTILRFVYVRPWETPGRVQQAVFRVSSVDKH